MLTTMLGLMVTLGASEPEQVTTLIDVNSPARTVETAARDYRIQVYTTFRQEREEYDQRIKAGRQVLLAWNKTNANPDTRDQFLRWYREALFATQPDNIADLPSRDDLPQILVSTEEDENDATRDEFDVQDAIQLDEAPQFDDASPSPDFFDTDTSPLDDSQLDETQLDDSQLDETSASQPSSPLAAIAKPLTKSAAVGALGRSLLRSFTTQQTQP